MRHPTKTEDGVIDAVFAHRFALRRHDGLRLFADLGSWGAEAVPRAEGPEVSIEGVPKPSELEVPSITRKGGERVAIRHDKPRDDGTVIDPAAAMAAVHCLGLAPVGEPRRKPKHFEVLARREGDLVEVHVAFAGVTQKEKPAGIDKRAKGTRAKGTRPTGTRVTEKRAMSAVRFDSTAA